MLRKLGLVVFSCFPLVAMAEDPVVTDGVKYKVLLENEQVRVLAYQDLPGEKTHQHYHPSFVLYAQGPFKRKISLPDGKVMIREFKEGDIIYSEGQTHIGENIGETPTKVIIVELKTDTKKVSPLN